MTKRDFVRSVKNAYKTTGLIPVQCRFGNGNEACPLAAIVKASKSNKARGRSITERFEKIYGESEAFTSGVIDGWDENEDPDELDEDFTDCNDASDREYQREYRRGVIYGNAARLEFEEELSAVYD